MLLLLNPGIYDTMSLLATPNAVECELNAGSVDRVDIALDNPDIHSFILIELRKSQSECYLLLCLHITCCCCHKLALFGL